MINDDRQWCIQWDFPYPIIKWNNFVLCLNSMDTFYVLSVSYSFCAIQEYPYIFPSFPSFRLSVFASVTASPAAASGPMHMIFGMKIYLDYGMLIFGKLRSEVKGQGHKSTKICLFGPILVIGLKSWYIEGRRGSGWVLLAACQLFLAACQMSQKSWGAPVGGSDTIGRMPAWLARCQMWKKPRPKHRATADARCTSAYILRIFQSVNPPHGQWPAPMGSWRVVYSWEVIFSYLFDMFSIVRFCVLDYEQKSFHYRLTKSLDWK